jgi:hypothetical protein
VPSCFCQCDLPGSGRCVIGLLTLSNVWARDAAEARSVICAALF